MSLQHDITIEGNLVKGVISGSIDYDNAVEMLEERKAVSENKPILLLTDITKVKSASNEAKKFLGSDEAAENVIANAILVKTYTTMMLGNVFLIFQKPKVPVRMFTDELKAIHWLRTYDPNLSSSELDKEHNRQILDKINSEK